MIRGFIGRGGSGKTFAAVSMLWRRHKMGRAIWSNTPLVDLRVEFAGGAWRPVNPETFGDSWAEGYVKKFDDIYDLENCDVFLDEIASWCPSHKWQMMPDEVRRFLAQDRREGVDIVWSHRTTRIFHDILENTAEINRCQRYGPVLVRQSYDPQDKAEKPTKTYGLVRSSVYDLYQTLARVGTATGEGYGLGKRQGYAASSGAAGVVALNSWGPHKLDIYVRPVHMPLLRRKFPERFDTLFLREGPPGTERYRMVGL